jgi:hypothetical protein
MSEASSSHPGNRRSWTFGLAVLVLAAGIAFYLGTAQPKTGKRSPTAPGVIVKSTSADTRAVSSAVTAQAPVAGYVIGQAELAPNGRYTTPHGSTARISSLRGKATMVWFIASGCATCAVSIPAVAEHLATLRHDGLEVLTLGLYGDFPSGSVGARQVVGFARVTAGVRVPRPGWHFGVASKALSLAYDPSGTPDAYVLIGPKGHLRYSNSVPVSTMTELLAAARVLGRQIRTAAAAGS